MKLTDSEKEQILTSLPDLISLAGFGINRAVYLNEKLLMYSGVLPKYDWGNERPLCNNVSVTLMDNLISEISTPIQLDIARAFTSEIIAYINLVEPTGEKPDEDNLEITATDNFNIEVLIKDWFLLRYCEETKPIASFKVYRKFVNNKEMKLEKLEI